VCECDSKCKGECIYVCMVCVFTYAGNYMCVRKKENRECRERERDGERERQTLM